MDNIKKTRVLSNRQSINGLPLQKSGLLVGERERQRERERERDPFSK